MLEVFAPEGTWFTPSVQGIWVPAGTMPHWQVHGNATVYIVDIPLKHKISTQQTPTLVEVQPLLKEILKSYLQNRGLNRAVEDRLLRVLVDEIKISSKTSTMVPVLHDERLQQVQDIVESDLTKTWTLTQLGETIGVSDRTLSRLFNQQVGASYITWRHQVRLHQATTMLAQGDTVKNVAAACGYPSASAFIAAFRNTFGRTPDSLYI
ncbi:MAG TPA: AraC family transcriptional regulator [Candidatus Yaniella excrementavium]|nr:AraC family transcriptional regulator [Candidatus Yaniella excrementavium]